MHTSDGTTQAYTFYCQTFTVGQFTESLLSSVVLTDGTQYSFTYDTSNQGVLNGVTLPTGGQIQFNYVNASVPRLASVTTAGGTWNFSQGGQTGLSGAGTATIASPLNDTTVITQDSTATRVASIQYYKGSATLLKTYAATYTTYPGQCRTTATITLNDTGQTAQTTYQNFFNGICSLPQQIQEWDYGAAAPTRTTKTTYIQDTSSNQYNTQYHIYDRPLSVAVYAGDGTNGSPIANTLYAYDEYSASYCKNGVPMLTNVTGAINHDDSGHGSSFTARGNITTIQRLISGSTYATSHSCYDTLGNVTQEVDANSNPSSFDYSENWADTTCIASGTNTHAFPTTITDALGHRTKNSYFTCTSLLQSRPAVR